jgi:hypothetical protein
MVLIEGKSPLYEALEELVASNKKLKIEVAHLNEVLHKKNIALDALHYVWCDGGCTSGMHRFSSPEITEEMVVAIERNTRRMRKWLDNNNFRKAYDN